MISIFNVTGMQQEKVPTLVLLTRCMQNATIRAMHHIDGCTLVTPTMENVHIYFGCSTRVSFLS